MLAMFCASTAIAQIPNPDFESWNTTTLQKPTGWRTYGFTQKVPGYKSPSALRLKRSLNQNDGPGAVIYGDPENNFSGGIPAAGRPDSAIGFFKLHVVPGDTGWYLVFFKRKGKIISEDIFYLTGSDTSKFNRLAFKINYKDTGLADTVVFGIASSNPNGNMQGSFIIADSLHLVGGIGKITIPNGNFESWQSVSFSEPLGWFTTNLRIPPGVSFPVTKSTDHAFSSFSARIENVNDGLGGFLQGYIMAGRQGNDGPKPGFAVYGKDSILYVNYKCSPKGTDSVNIAIMMFYHDTMIGMGSLVQGQTITNWTQAAIPINYWGPQSRVPDSAVIYCAAFQGGESATGNSVLYVDGFQLNTPMNSTTKFASYKGNAYPNPACNEITVQVPFALGKELNVMLVNAAGEIVKPVFTYENTSGRVVISTAELPAGIWHYQLNSLSGQAIGTFIILK